MLDVTRLKYYSGVGSRQSPDDVLSLMTRIAESLRRKGYILRSGGAPGADTAFEAGAGSCKEIYLPWRGFQNSKSLLYRITPAAMDLARQFHPGFSHLSQGAQKLMARNGYQVLGYDLATPSEFVVCWTPDGCTGRATRSRGTGGTGQAICIAEAYGIPVINLHNNDRETREHVAQLL